MALRACLAAAVLLGPSLLDAIAQVAPDPLSGTATNHSACSTERNADLDVTRCGNSVTVRDSHATRKLPLPPEIVSVALAAPSPTRGVLVIGTLAGGFEEVFLYRADTLELQSSHSTYFASVSADRRWVSYQEFLPPPGMEPLHARLVLLSTTNPAAAAPFYQGPSDSWLTGPGLWSPDSTRVLFQVVCSENSALVLKEASGSAIIIPISYSSVCTGNSLENGKCHLTLLSAGIDSDKITAVFDRIGDHGRDTVKHLFANGIGTSGPSPAPPDKSRSQYPDSSRAGRDPDSSRQGKFMAKERHAFYPLHLPAGNSLLNSRPQ